MGCGFHGLEGSAPTWRGAGRSSRPDERDPSFNSSRLRRRILRESPVMFETDAHATRHGLRTRGLGFADPHNDPREHQLPMEIFPPEKDSDFRAHIERPTVRPDEDAIGADIGAFRLDEESPPARLNITRSRTFKRSGEPLVGLGSNGCPLIGP